jgi:hypothetical protein
MKHGTQHLGGLVRRFWDNGVLPGALVGLAPFAFMFAVVGSVNLTSGHAVRPAQPPCERVSIVWSRDMPSTLPIKIPAGGALIGTDPGEWVLVVDGCTISRADMHRASKGVAGRGRVVLRQGSAAHGSGFDSRHSSPTWCAEIDRYGVVQINTDASDCDSPPIIISPGGPIVTGG